MIQLNGNTGYYYDFIRINSPQYTGFLFNKLPRDLLERESGSFRIFRAYPAARSHGFQTRIEIVAPTVKCLEILLENESLLNLQFPPRRHFYKISYLEIARDQFYGSPLEAESAAQLLTKTFRKKWSSDTSRFDFLELDTSNQKQRKGPGAFGQYTWYYGGKNNRYVIYTRFSKINYECSLHEEWRIVGATLIREKTWISSIFDLIDFDLEDFFTTNRKKYISHDKIDKFKLGKWILGWTRKRKFTNEQIRKIYFQGNMLCRDKKLRCFADLVTYFRKRKSKIKSKKGRKSKLDVRFLNVNYNYFKIRKED